MGTGGLDDDRQMKNIVTRIGAERMADADPESTRAPEATAPASE
jgi:hypothetical protein